ncbi:hypothetical protein [Sulfitobacter sp.]|uniref:hypothetical protein n=1 Tax=Sulfitobacter sp. TaxID=1903071 RepID=UPI003001F5D4
MGKGKGSFASLSKRHKGSGVIGMGLSELGRGGGAIVRKPLPTMALLAKNNKIGLKARVSESAIMGFALRARMSKTKKPPQA